MLVAEMYTVNKITYKGWFDQKTICLQRIFIKYYRIAVFAIEIIQIIPKTK